MIRMLVIARSMQQAINDLPLKSNDVQYSFLINPDIELTKFIERDDNTPDVDCDVIRGHRLTDAESMRLMCPDLPMFDEEVFKEVLEPFINEDK